MAQQIDIPIYTKIALDLAGRICNGEIREGSRIFGRSTLAAEYNVSPETIRRAVNLLEDMNVVRSSQGSGIFVSSKSNAYSFIERYQNKESIHTLKNDMKKLIHQKQAIENNITQLLDKIDDSHLIGKTITETKFWQNTGATIIAIKRDGSLILSPGPYGGFEKGDTIFVVGDLNVIERIKKFMAEP